MPSPSILPLEIEEKVIDLLAEDDDDHSALKTCSLVCQSFLPICRKHIFAFIVLNDPESEPPYPTLPYLTANFLERLLSERPEIAGYIRKLYYNIHVSDLICPSIPKSLKRISRLKSLTLCYHHHFTLPYRLDWSCNPIRQTLLHLLHLPTLTHFKLQMVQNFVVSDLIPCVNLKHLDISNYTTVATETTPPAAFPEYPIQLNEFVARAGTGAAIMKLSTARRPDGQSLIDFRSLSKITVAVREPDESEAAQELFRRCETLTEVDITFWEPRNVRPSLGDMLRPSMRTLKRIVVEVHVDNDHDDPLFGIPAELEDMRDKNIIESITIRVIAMQADCSRGDDWGRLDAVLTSSGWFVLQRVSLAIKVDNPWRRWMRRDELEMAFQKLPETQFPRLSASKSVLFDFEVTFVSE